ncbi:Hypothetical_protein [Hexamita inflata]|uniref:Hypothetical_protein n=1 Tax=Hexamita inflata TaxID=28002 RepID=A0AA86NDI8_9EUKA|nr:Hypothetical protein HINF_LOCUS4976 [Hexamita inflata]
MYNYILDLSPISHINREFVFSYKQSQPTAEHIRLSLKLEQIFNIREKNQFYKQKQRQFQTKRNQFQQNRTCLEKTLEQQLNAFMVQTSRLFNLLVSDESQFQ